MQFEIKDKAMTELSVSILSADLANLAAETADSMVCGADMVHFDVMDGHFVPNITYGAPVLKCLKKAVPEAFYDVHLMISDPARYAQDFATAGANLINFHIEAVPNHVGQTIAAVRETGCLVGLTISPSTPPQAVFPYLDELDLVLVMGVEPGRDTFCSAGKRPAPVLTATFTMCGTATMPGCAAIRCCLGPAPSRWAVCALRPRCCF